MKCAFFCSWDSVSIHLSFKSPQNTKKIERRKSMQTKILLKRLARRRVQLTVIGNVFKLHSLHSLRAAVAHRRSVKWG